jgi:hypothetical protein
MPLASWTMMRFYDARIDAEGIRFSGISERGGEFWIREALAPEGRSRREQREMALQAMEDAIDRGDEPGEVVTALEGRKPGRSGPG